MQFHFKIICLVLTIIFAAVTSFAAEPIEAGPDPVKLVGRWLRADGGYVLQLTDPDPDGHLQAAYFNPQPINVSAAAWKHQGGYLGAFVELRAPNYPGSTYTLAYDQENDRLVGIYYQAVMKQQFDVVFVRTPSGVLMK